MSLNMNLNNIPCYRNAGGALAVINKYGLSWTYNEKLGFDADGENALDRLLKPNAEDTKFVESHCGTFDGVDDYMNMLNDTSLDLGAGDHTITALMKLDSYTGFGGLTNRRISSTATIGFCYYVNNGFLGAFDGGTGQATTQMALNTWYYVAIRYTKSTGLVEFFLDGVAAGTTTKTGFVSNGFNTYIGSFSASGGGGHVNACIAHMSFYNAKLTDTQIQSNSYVEDASMVASYVFTEGDLITVYDVGSNGNHGTLGNVTVASFWASKQDLFHYLINRGGRLSGGVEIPALLDGTAAADSNPITNPADYWHNGVDTSYILGATTFDGTGWDVNADVKTADTDYILHNSSTGYGIPLAYDDLTYEQGNYLFYNVSTDDEHKDLILFSTPPTGKDAILVHKFVGNGDNLTTDLDGNYVYDLDDYPIWSE